MSFRNLPLDSILEGKHGQPWLLQRPSGASPLLGEVLTASPPGWQKAWFLVLDSCHRTACKTPHVRYWESQISRGRVRERAQLQEEEGHSFSCPEPWHITMALVLMDHGELGKRAEQREEVSLSSLHHTPLSPWTLQGAEPTFCPHGTLTPSEITPSQNSEALVAGFGTERC